MEEPTSQGTVVEVDPVDLHEEAVNDLIWPETVNPRGHMVCAVCEFLINPAEGDDTQFNFNMLRQTWSAMISSFHGALKGIMISAQS